MISLMIQPHDTIVVRDGRPFGSEAGNRMHILEWPYPSTMAGFLRTFIGKRVGTRDENPFKNAELLSSLKKIKIQGPFPMIRKKLYFPAPRDVVIFTDKERYSCAALRPCRLREGEGCNIPIPYRNILWPVQVTQNIKSTNGPAFWSVDKIACWLGQDPMEDMIISEKGDGFLAGFQKEERVHVGIDPLTSCAMDEIFYFTSGLVMYDLKENGSREQVAMGARVKIDKSIFSLDKANLQGLHPFGGERRLVQVNGEEALGWEMPEIVAVNIKKALGLRMILATPGIFERGWLPRWLDEKTLEGNLPGTELRVRLRGACLDRWKPVSGWDLKTGKCKAVRRIVPAGSVYFFEILAGNPMQLKDQWLKSVCDERQDRCDGFGLVLWGIWRKEQVK